MFKRFLLMLLMLFIFASAAFAAEQAENGTEGNSTSIIDEAPAQVIPADYTEEGVASWYGEKFQGKVTASGEPYDMEKLTAAHNYLPLGVKVTVTNLGSGKSVAVTINDRGPFVPDRIIDLSRAAAEKLGFIDAGKANVRIEPYRPEVKKEIVAAPVVTKLYGAFYIQVGAYKIKENADRLIERLGKAGFNNARLVRVVTDTAQIFKVQLGMYKTLASARKASLKIGAGFPGSFVLADVIQE
ncbi:rare lipoprotein A [Maridesulfovibrio ferrireducens]|uniref:Probable endolytic peptidoglycan transglycosylase RlpA n=1 Tax=Maridesulfovibrio ferrireducens TaxID=246191 RepID=A0A1G9AWM3_9BACT|nr:septal ring lytic transglycosylase RlpA family protein [Maridesulfovibrio ferrireducens]SDK31100.1 rare lipoprotein A [Maridesulfovibrio ferrireducens]